MSNNIELTVIDVTRDNLVMMWPSILYAIKSSTFIAADLVWLCFSAEENDTLLYPQP